MKKYDNYKDSGIEWIGEIPEHWDRIRIKSLVAIKVTDGPHETPQWIENGVPFISAEAIKGNKIDLDFKRGYISTEQHLEYCKKSKVLKNDILFCKSGSTTGKSALVDTDVDFGIWSPLAIIRADKNKIDYKYLFQSIQSSLFQNQVETAWTFGTQPNIGMGALENLWIAIPTLEEQQSIANYLDHKTTQIDTLIAKKEQFISLLQEERTAVINQAVTKGLDPKVKMKDSGIEWLGEIPEHWKLMRVGSLSQCITGFAFKSDNFSFENGIKIVRGDNVTENSLRWGDKTRYWNEYSEVLDRFQLQKNDIVIGMDGSKVGKNYAYVEEKDLPLLLVQRVARIRSNSELIAKWIHFNIGTYNFKYYINLSKTDPAIPHITLKNITSYPICIPDINELNLIIEKLNSKLEKLDETLKKSKQEIELLKEYKTALISEVVTGKVDVRDVILN